MSIVIPAAAVVFALIAAALVVLFRRLASPGPDALPSGEWWATFSLEKYRPMERLFAPEDYEFLAAHPGFTPALARRLQAERRKIFRRYLRCLSRDFDRLYIATKLLLLTAAEDRSELALALWKQRLSFKLGLVSVHAQLGLQTLGLGTVQVQGLVRAMERMREQLQLLSPQPAPAPLYRR
jgi:hypothetical protein